MNQSRHGFPAGARIVATVVDAAVAIVEAITSLDPFLAEWASGPRLVPARVWTGRR